MSRVESTETQTQSQPQPEPTQVSQLEPDQSDQPEPNRRNVWKSDKKLYNEWMSRRSYYRKMVKKYSELAKGSDPVKSDLARSKVAVYQEKEHQADIAIEESRKHYGIGRRERGKKTQKDPNNDSSSDDDHKVDDLI